MDYRAVCRGRRVALARDGVVTADVVWWGQLVRLKRMLLFVQLMLVSLSIHTVSSILRIDTIPWFYTVVRAASSVVIATAIMLNARDRRRLAELAELP
jgi:hypothetical protein